MKPIKVMHKVYLEPYEQPLNMYRVNSDRYVLAVSSKEAKEKADSSLSYIEMNRYINDNWCKERN